MIFRNNVPYRVSICVQENAANENVQRVARQKHIDINVHFRDAPVRGRGGRVIRSNRFGYKGGNFEANENFGGEPRPFVSITISTLCSVVSNVNVFVENFRENHATRHQVAEEDIVKMLLKWTTKMRFLHWGKKFIPHLQNVANTCL